MLYVPGSTEEATLIAPVVVFRVMPAGHAPDVAMVEFADVAAAPFTVSLVRTLAMGVDAVPETAVPLSVTGLIAAAHEMNEIALIPTSFTSVESAAAVNVSKRAPLAGMPLGRVIARLTLVDVV